MNKGGLGAKVLKLFLAVIVFVILVLVVLYLYRYSKVFSARQKISRARPLAEKVSDKRISDYIELLTQEGILGTKIVSSKTDVCYVNYEGGFGSKRWYQDCYLRYVGGFSAMLNQNEVSQKLLSLPRVEQGFGNDQQYCSLFTQDGIVIRFRPAHSPYDVRCRVPRQIQGDSVRGPALLDKELTIKTYESFDENTIDTAQDQVWIEFDSRYYHEELGCAIDLGLFCENPRPIPVATD